jgi:hypothetical protein
MTSTISTRPNRFDDIEILSALGTVRCPVLVVLVVVAAAAAAAAVVVVVPWLALIRGIA